MPVMFVGGQIGRVVSLKDHHAAGSVKFLEVKPPYGFDTHKAIITRVTVAHQGNYQFLHTMGGDVYIYVFGDRIGSLTLSGLGFTTNDSDCASGGKHGFEYLLDYYKENRVANRKKPVEVTVGKSTAFDAFLVGINEDVVDPKTRIVQYNYQMVVVPEKD